MGSQSEIQRFEDLVVWKKAMNLSVLVYGISQGNGLSKDWGLWDQLRRAAISIPSNIAEGFGRFSSKDFRYFLAIANGSANEPRSQIHLAQEFGSVDPTTAGCLVGKSIEVSRMIKGLRKKQSKRPCAEKRVPSPEYQAPGNWN